MEMWRKISVLSLSWLLRPNIFSLSGSRFATEQHQISPQNSAMSEQCPKRKNNVQFQGSWTLFFNLPCWPQWMWQRIERLHKDSQTFHICECKLISMWFNVNYLVRGAACTTSQRQLTWSSRFLFLEAHRSGKLRLWISVRAQRDGRVR